MGALSGLLEPRTALLISAVTLLLAGLGAALVPIALARLPEDYLLRENDPLRVRFARAGALGRLELVARNLAGLALLLLGLLLLVMPGQGLLTILLGLALLDVPGKRALERRLLARPGLRRAVDWMRRRRGQPPLKIPGELPSSRDPHAG